MKLIVSKAMKLINRNNNAAKAVREFLDMHVKCVEFVDHGYAHAKCAAHRLYMELRKLNIKNVRVAVRNKTHVYLINTLIEEEE